MTVRYLGLKSLLSLGMPVIFVCTYIIQHVCVYYIGIMDEAVQYETVRMLSDGI